VFRNKANLYGEELFVTRTTPKLQDHSLLSVHDRLFNIFAATLHIGGGRDSVVQDWRKFLRALPPLSIKFEEIHLSAHGNFEG